MITQTYFRRYCNKLFNNACEFKSDMANDMEMRIKCYFNGRLVAKLYVREDLKTVADVYRQDQCSTSTSFKLRFRHLLKKYTYVDRHKADVIKEISKMVNSKFYASADDIWKLIDKITDDIFTADLYQIASQLMDKADVQRFGTIKWRNSNKERSKEG